MMKKVFLRGYSYAESLDFIYRGFVRYLRVLGMDIRSATYEGETSGGKVRMYLLACTLIN